MSPEANWAVEVLQVQVAKIYLVYWCNNRWFLFRSVSKPEVVRSVFKCAALVQLKYTELYFTSWASVAIVSLFFVSLSCMGICE